MTLTSFPDMLAAAEKIYIYALVHPLIEAEVKYVGVTLKPNTIIETLKTKKSNVARWVKYLCRMNTEPEVVILEEVDISEDKRLWYASKRYWVNHFISRGCELLNRKPKIEKLSRAQRAKILKKSLRFAWTPERIAKRRKLMFERLAAWRERRRKIVKLADKVLANERYREFLNDLHQKK